MNAYLLLRSSGDPRLGKSRSAGRLHLGGGLLGGLETEETEEVSDLIVRGHLMEAKEHKSASSFR
jgi:hypothetical protein